MPVERREHARHPAPGAVVFYSFSDDESGEMYVNCPVQNISLGGIEFLTPHEIPAGQTLSLIMRVPERPPDFNMHGRVRWCKAEAGGKLYRTGVTLLEMGILERVRIAEIVKDLGTKYSKTQVKAPPTKEPVKPAAGKEPPEEVRNAVRDLSDMETSKELLMDLVQAVRAGANFDQIFTPDDVAAAKAATGARQLVERRIPLYELDGANRIRMTADGDPLEQPVGAVPLPESDSEGLFACRTQVPMGAKDSEFKLRAGALLVFSRSALPIEDDVVIAPFAEEGVVCRLSFLPASNSVSLKPLHSGEDDNVVHANLIAFMWKLVGFYEHL